MRRAFFFFFFFPPRPPHCDEPQVYRERPVRGWSGMVVIPLLMAIGCSSGPRLDRPVCCRRGADQAPGALCVVLVFAIINAGSSTVTLSLTSPMRPPRRHDDGINGALLRRERHRPNSRTIPVYVRLRFLKSAE